MKKMGICALLLCLFCLLFGSVSAQAAEAEHPMADALPTEYRVTDESAEEILALAKRSGLKHIDAIGCTEYEALLKLRELLPECEIVWEVAFQGVSYPSDTETLAVTDLEGLEDALRALPALTRVDLLETKARLEDLERYRAIRPDVFYLWEFWIDGRLVRTDTRVYSSLLGVEIRSRDIDYYYPVLAYCPYLKALDLGHNGITDVTLIGELQDLEVLILADNRIADLSPLGKLSNLIYLELFLNKEAEDFSFLNHLTKLKDLNLCYCYQLDNLDFLESLPELCFLMVKRTAIPREEFDAWRERLPEVKMVYYDGDPESTGSGWRMTGRSQMIRTAFACWQNIVRYDSYNDYELRINGGVHPISDYYSEDHYT